MAAPGQAVQTVQVEKSIAASTAITAEEGRSKVFFDIS